MVLKQCASSHCHLSINQVSFQSRLTVKDIAQTGIHYKTKWLSGDNSVNMKIKWLRGKNSVNILGRIMVIVHSHSSHCHLSINQVPLQSISYFSRYGLDRQHLRKMVKGR